MRAIIQRVDRASVSVSGEFISSIGKGLCILIGIQKCDSVTDAEYLARKITNLRIFNDDDGVRWKKSVKDLNLEIISVSQFTLHSKLKGNKPDFHCSMGGEEAKQMYENFMNELRKQYNPSKIKDGEFGAMMKVDIVNDGPVTILLESPSEKGTETNKDEND